MGGITKINGHVLTDQFYGRELAIVNVAKTNMSQADVDAMYTALALRSTVMAIGSFTANTSDNIKFIVEGLAFDVTADQYGPVGSYNMTYLEELSSATGLTVTASPL